MKITVTDRFLWGLYRIFEDLTATGRDAAVPIRITMKNRLYFLTDPFFDMHRRKMGRRKFGKFVSQLKRSGYISAASLKSGKAIMLTSRGEAKALRASFLAEKQKKRKDGKWIMLMFDLPANYEAQRKVMRSLLCNMGYKMLQQSVWVCADDALEKTKKLLQFHELDEYVRLFLIEPVR